MALVKCMLSGFAAGFCKIGAVGFGTCSWACGIEAIGSGPRSLLFDELHHFNLGQRLASVPRGGLLELLCKNFLCSRALFVRPQHDDSPVCIDLACATGDDVEIEERGADELTGLRFAGTLGVLRRWLRR